jgi:glutathionyl-hydroquinone reductase
MTQGAFVRRHAVFREQLEHAESGRYHLYVALACPWSHRAVIVRQLKGLEDAVSMSLLHPYRDERGWRFTGGRFEDPVNDFEFLHQAYECTVPGYDDRVSVPVLWDKQEGRIVSNESADIIRMFDSAFEDATGPELYPESLRGEIDAVNELVYEAVNNGVYRAGFAETQEAYEEAFDALFATLAQLEQRLGSRRYLAGDVLTEADWRLFPTLVRFDEVYNVHFRCNGRRLIDHPNLWAYARELYQRPGIAETVAMDEIKRHYYTTHDSLNPKRIIPKGPLDADWNAPHGRDRASVG